MKKVFLFTFFFLITVMSFGQSLFSVETTDWNKIQKAGFFFGFGNSNSHLPLADNRWWWGLSSPSGGNLNAGNYTYYNAQIVIRSNKNPAEMYIRSTNHLGLGDWAKVIHSVGDHAIAGKLTVREVEVKINAGADFVFHENYILPSLTDVENHIKVKKHLIDIPSEKEMVENGLNINEMQIKLLQKIEELTLYVIELDKKDKEKAKLINQQEELIKELQNKIDK